MPAHKRLIFRFLTIVLTVWFAVLGPSLYAQTGSANDKLNQLKSQASEYKNNNEPIKLAQTYSKMAYIYTQLEDYGNAIKFYKESASLYLNNDHYDDARKSYSNIGFIYSHEDKFESSLKYLNQALKVAKSQNKQEAISGCLTDIAYILTIQQEHRTSIDKLLEALTIAQKIDHKQLIVKCMAMLMENYRALGMTAKYMEYQKKLNNYSNHVKEESNQEHVNELQIKNQADQERALLEAANHELELKLAEAEKEKLEREKEEELRLRDISIAEAELKNNQMRYEQEKLLLEDKKKSDLIAQQEKEKHEEHERFVLYAWAGGIILFLLLLILLLIIWWSYKNRKYNKILKEKNSEIQAQNEKLNSMNAILEQNSEELKATLDETESQKKAINDSIAYAMHIQRSMLVSSETIQDLLPKSFIFFQPRDEVSGDFYWFHHKEIDGVEYTYIAAIDCTGHGVPGAMISMVGYNVLENIMTDPSVIHPNQIMERLHVGIRRSLKQALSNNHDGMDMALCLIRKDERIVEYCGAKNALIYVEDGKAEKVKPDGYGIGGFLHGLNSDEDDYRKFTNNVLEAPETRTFYIFSDGYSDQFGGPNDKKYMLGRFRNELVIVSSVPIEKQGEKLHKDFLEWKGYTEQTDDVLVIGFKL